MEHSSQLLVKFLWVIWRKSTSWIKCQFCHKQMVGGVKKVDSNKWKSLTQLLCNLFHFFKMKRFWNKFFSMVTILHIELIPIHVVERNGVMIVLKMLRCSINAIRLVVKAEKFIIIQLVFDRLHIFLSKNPWHRFVIRGSE